VVTDASGAVVPDAKVTMTNTATNFAVPVINEDSVMVQASAPGATRPAQTGTISNALNSVTLAGTAARDAPDV